MLKWLLIACCGCCLGSVGCSAQAPTLPTPRPAITRLRTATPVPQSDEEAIRQLINAECDAVVQQDIDRLQDIWASDGVVTDANHTPDDPSGHVIWKGWDAMRDRYVNIVFPSSPTFCEHPDVQVTVNGDSATAISGVRIGTTNAPNSNKWVFKKIDGSWKISSLTYNLNPQK